MSADLMVFDKSKAPAEPMEFLKWFYEKMAWTTCLFRHKYIFY